MSGTPFTCVDAATGEILYSGTADDPSHLGSSGVQVVQGVAVSSGYWNGAGFAEIPPRPDVSYVWNWQTHSWVDARNLAAAQTSKLAELRDAREAAINSTFEWDGSVFDSDQVSQTRLLGLYLDSREEDFVATSWRLSDNSWRELSAEDARGVWLALKNHVKTHFDQFAEKEAQVMAAGTVAAVDAIQW